MRSHEQLTQEEKLLNFKETRLNQYSRLLRIISDVSSKFDRSTRKIKYEYDRGNDKGKDTIIIDENILVALYSSARIMRNDLSTIVIHENKEAIVKDDPVWKEKADKLFEESRNQSISKKLP